MEEGSDSRKTILERGADQGAEVDQDHDPERARDPTVEVGADPGLALVMPSALDQGLDLDPGVQRPRELTEIKAGADLDPGLLPKERSHDQDHETDHNPGLGVQIASLIDQDLERDQGLDHQQNEGLPLDLLQTGMEGLDLVRGHSRMGSEKMTRCHPHLHQHMRHLSIVYVV